MYIQIIDGRTPPPSVLDGTDNTSSSQLLVSFRNPAHLLPRRVFCIRVELCDVHSANFRTLDAFRCCL
jgi:hypothetical protein